MSSLTFNKSSNIFYSSDWHLGHRNMVRGVSKWDIENTRDFQTLEEHDEIIIDNINRTIKADDILMYLGDFCLGNYNQITAYRKKIRCKNIHFVLGNHDRDIAMNKKNCRSLFTSVQPKLEITVAGQKITLDHYACRTWNQGHRGAIHLYGHSHDNLDKEIIWGKSMDVGIDSAYRILGVYKPFSFTEIMNIMDKREIYQIDHHV